MTTAQRIGALAAFVTALVGVYLGTRTVTNPSGTRACIQFDGAKPGGLKVTRAIVALSPQAQTLLGLSPVTGPAYAGVEVQAQDGTDLPAATKAVMEHVDIIPDTVWDRTAQGAVAPACQVLIVRQDDPAITSGEVFACGCSTGASCTWNGSAGPKGVTFDPGTFTGTGCRRTPCVGLLGWPSPLHPECR